jgi:hypothetical protein
VFDAVGVAEHAEQDPVRLRNVVLPVINLDDAGRDLAGMFRADSPVPADVDVDGGPLS